MGVVISFVALTKTAKFTVRRLHDGSYASIEVGRTELVTIVADIEITEGDPDKWANCVEDGKPAVSAHSTPNLAVEVLVGAVGTGEISAVDFARGMGMLIKSGVVKDEPRTIAAYGFQLGDVVEIDVVTPAGKTVERGVVESARDGARGERLIDVRWTSGPHAHRLRTFQLGIDSVRLLPAQDSTERAAASP